MKVKIEKARGVLNPKEGLKKFDLTLYLPSQELAFFVEHYWIVNWDLRGQEPYTQETLPHPSVHVVFEKDNSKIWGIVTGKFLRYLVGKGRVIGIKFKPGAFYPFVKSPVSWFTDTLTSIADTFHVDEKAWEQTILSVESETEMVACAAKFLRERLPAPDDNVTLINHIVDYIIANRDITKVDDVVSQLGVNKRTLQRLFNQYVGVSPKWVIKRYRLHDAAEQLASGQTSDYSGIAFDLGYFDQAHFIKDFKAIIGKTPAQYVRQSAS